MAVTARPPLPLYWKVCLINGAIFLGATALLVVSPATVSPQVTVPELILLAVGLAVVLATNSTLLYGTLAPLDRLVDLIDQFDADGSNGRLPEQGGGVAAKLARSFNALLERLEAERAARSGRALATQEAERHRISRELHDEVGQRLTVVLLGVKRALDLASPAAEQELRLVQDNARTSLEEVRRLARGLRPGVLEDLGLVPALAAMANELTASTQLEVRRRLDQRLPTLTPEADLVIFRVAQEALTNVTRHAQASSVEVRLYRTCQGVCLRVVDDGLGIRDGVTGAGLSGMRERAVLVGGQVHVGPGPDGGTEVQLEIPLAKASR